VALHTSVLARCDFSKHRNVFSSLPFTCRHKELRTRRTTRVFHFEVTSQDVRIYINITSTALSIAWQQTAKSFPLLTLLSFITFYPVLYPIYFTVPYRLYLRNDVTCLCISSNLIIPFSVKQCYNSQRSKQKSVLSLHISFCISNIYLKTADLDSRNM
jgi:hypothetical protein